MSAGYVLFKIRLFNYMIVIVIDIEMWLKWGCGFSPTLLFSHYQQVITINKLENLSSILVDRYYITFVTQYKKNNTS
jgi:hypothetical protein